MKNSHVATTDLQLKMFYVKYMTTRWKMYGALSSGNYPMFEQYNRDLKIMRQSLSILGIHIDEINR